MSIDPVAGPSTAEPVVRLLPCYPCALTPGGRARLQGDPSLYVTSSGGLRPWVPATMPTVLFSADQGVATSTPKRSRRALNRRDKDIVGLLEDSASGDSDGEGVDGDLRRDQDSEYEDDDDIWEKFDRKVCQMDSALIEEDELIEERVEDESMENESEEKMEHPVNKDYIWSEDFTSFTGQKEKYLRVPGPTFGSQDPTDIFYQIWDREFMETIVKQTNEYAWQCISQLSEPGFGSRIPKYLDTWTETTVEELYRYFAVLIYLSFCQRSNIREYWNKGVMGMSSFRGLMSRNRFLMLSRFIHFVDNENLVSSGYARKIMKVTPVIDHCNKKFADLYTPYQHLSLDESLLLWKGRLSWKQCIRTKAARFGLKSFELCDATNGYLLQYRLYTGKDDGLQSGPSKIVLELMDSYLDAGHILVMDNWYNQLPMTRYLKSRCTDVLGTINRRRHHVPQKIKDLNPKELRRGDTVSMHCGDIALVAWQDVRLVTLMSTYHQHLMVPATRARQATLKPLAVEEYNQYMGGVDLKDQKLSMFLFERKRNKKWYLKVFRRLFNTSLLNAYIIYLRNPMYRVYSHREFRYKVAEGLLRRNPNPLALPPIVRNPVQELRLIPGRHFPIHTDKDLGPGKTKHKRLRCVRCTALSKRVLVTIRCKLCRVPLCIDQCWEDYHTLEKL